VIPKVQSGANKANKKRVNATKEMASQITESISGVHEVHAHGSFFTEEQKYNTIIDKLLNIRIIWTLYRQAVKVTNNLFVGFGPVIVFILGGYLIMKGEINLGALVAFLSAQEKLYDPWKDLINFYQVYQDASVRYASVMQSFGEESEFRLEKIPGSDAEIGNKVEIKNLDFVTPDGVKLLDQVNLTVEAGEHLALVGFSGSGKSILVKAIGQLYKYTGGSVLLGGNEVDELSKRDVVKKIGFVSQDPFIFTGTVDENLLYACKALSGMSVETSALAPDLEPSLDKKIQILQEVGLFVDILRLGLNTIIDHQAYPGLEEKVLILRQNFQKNFGRELAKYVEFYEDFNYLYHSSVMDNLIFGTPLNTRYASDKLVDNTEFLGFLDCCNLKKPLLETGSDLILQTVSILGSEPVEEVFLTQTPICAQEYSHGVKIARQLESLEVDELEDTEQKFILTTALRFVPSRHKILRLQPHLKEMILNGRNAFRQWCSKHAPGAVIFYSNAEYIRSQSILNNIFYGNLTTSSPKINDRVNQCAVFLLVEEDLLEQVVGIGMNFDVGNCGDNLSGGQQQKLSIARVLLKDPKLLIMDEATSALDNKSQDRIHKVMENWKGKRTVISVIHRLDMLGHYDKVAVMKTGKIVECGKTEDLLANKGVLHELIHGKDG
jgi:ABC-type multidrug transport system fused ATPase/permease subunit